MGQRDDKEKEKTRRVETAKLCYNICHSIITITVLGNAAPLFGIGDKDLSISLLFFGILAASIFFFIGFTILKK